VSHAIALQLDGEEVPTFLGKCALRTLGFPPATASAGLRTCATPKLAAVGNAGSAPVNDNGAALTPASAPTRSGGARRKRRKFPEAAAERVLHDGCAGAAAERVLHDGCARSTA